MKNILNSRFCLNEYVGIIVKDERIIALSLYTMKYMLLNENAYKILQKLSEGYTPNEIIVSLTDEANEHGAIQKDVFECMQMILKEKICKMRK